LFENRHGVRIVVTQDGQLGNFTLVNFMFFAASAAATFALASFVVDTFVFRWLIGKKTRAILDRAANTTTPVRSEIEGYIHAVEEETRKQYEAPASFWELEKQLVEYEAATGTKVTIHPTFRKNGAQNLQTQLVSEKSKEHQNEEKVAKLETALSFANTLLPTEDPPISRQRSEDRRERARQHWAIARAGVRKELRQRRKAQRKVWAQQYREDLKRREAEKREAERREAEQRQMRETQQRRESQTKGGGEYIELTSTD
jgi:hypothetical protein